MKRFACAQCGNCCRQSGDLRLLPEDVEKILAFFGMTFGQFCGQYDIRDVEKKLFFLNVRNGCPFLSGDSKCILQDAKPFFCANYIPFIDGASSPIYSVCRGIGQGKEWTEEEIHAVYQKMLSRLVIVHERSDSQWQ